MSSITQALRTAQSGLTVNQQALNAISQNVANANTEGYSRKVISLEQRVVNGSGAGVQISEISRRVDENLLKSLRREISKTATLTGKSTTFDRVQQLLGTPDDNRTISHTLSNFVAAIETLAATPENSLEQNDLARWGRDVADQLKNMSDTIQELRLQADTAISDDIKTINTLTSKISDLNNEIIANGSVNRDVTDLQDQRDQAIDSLAEFVDIRYFIRSDGDVVVFTSAGRTLVDNSAVTLTHNTAASITPTLTHAEGDISGIYVGDSIAGNDITNELREGKLQALVSLRDVTLTDIQSQIDNLSVTLRDTFNQVMNRGVAFPGGTSFTGTTQFIAPGTQTITLDATNSVDDVTFALLDNSGDQSAVTTLNTIMQDATLGTGAQASRGPWDITEVAATIEDWFQANGAASATATVNSSGYLAIELNSTTLNFAIRDQVATANGSAAGDAEIGFDRDGDGNIDKTVSGFSNFFGLNDFFQDNLSENLWASDVVSSSFTTTAATLTFRDSTGALAGSPLTVTSGTTLAELATSITNSVTNVTASVVPDGAGSRLRIAHANGSAMTVTQGGADTLLTTLGLDVADVRVSTALTVRSDIISSPGLIARGQLQYDANLGLSGEYFNSSADDTVITQLADTFTSTVSFKKSGGLSAVTVTFESYGADIISDTSSDASRNESNLEIQSDLTNSLQLKSDNVRGVNIDEELSNLIVFEQAYSAAARIISTIQNMFDALERII